MNSLPNEILLNIMELTCGKCIINNVKMFNKEISKKELEKLIKEDKLYNIQINKNSFLINKRFYNISNELKKKNNCNSYKLKINNSYIHLCLNHVCFEEINNIKNTFNNEMKRINNYSFFKDDIINLGNEFVHFSNPVNFYFKYHIIKLLSLENKIIIKGICCNGNGIKVVKM